jgi:hypothetical protein
MSAHTHHCQDKTSTQYLLSIPQNLSNTCSENLSDAQLATRAILRKDAHRDNHHFEGTEDGGLHRLTTALFTIAGQGSVSAENCTALVENTFNDALDTVSRDYSLS